MIVLGKDKLRFSGLLLLERSKPYEHLRTEKVTDIVR